jgi:hypothetical protein
VVVRASLVASSAVFRIDEGIDLAAVRYVGIAVLKTFGASHDLAAAAEALRLGVIEVTRGVALAAVVEVRRQGHFAAVLGALVAVRRARTTHELTRARGLGTGDALTTGVRRWGTVGVVVAWFAYVTPLAFAATIDPALATVVNLIVARGFLANAAYTVLAGAVFVISASPWILAPHAVIAAAVNIGLVAIGHFVAARSIVAAALRAFSILAIRTNDALLADATRFAVSTAILVGLRAIDDVIAAVRGQAGVSRKATATSRRRRDETSSAARPARSSRVVTDELELG